MREEPVPDAPSSRALFAPCVIRRLPARERFEGGYGEGARHAFTVMRPGPLVFELFSRRLGESADGVVTLEDSEGRPLARWDDVTNAVLVGSIVQQELDPYGRYDFASPGVYYARVTEACGRSGRYRLEIREPTPHFNVYSKCSGFDLAKGQRQPFTVVVDRREGFAGPVRLIGNARCRIGNAVIPADVTEAKVVAVGELNESNEPEFGTVLAVGEAGGETLAVEVVAADEYSQAFAWDHLLSLGGFVFRNRPAKGVR